jgi:hypothetical protein
MKVSPSSHLRRLDHPSGSRPGPVFNDSICETDLSSRFVEWLRDLDEAVLKATTELQEQSRFGRLVIASHTLIRKALAQIDASRTWGAGIPRRMPEFRCHAAAAHGSLSSRAPQTVRVSARPRFLWRSPDRGTGFDWRYFGLAKPKRKLASATRMSTRLIKDGSAKANARSR